MGLRLTNKKGHIGDVKVNNNGSSDGGIQDPPRRPVNMGNLGVNTGSNPTQHLQQ